MIEEVKSVEAPREEPMGMVSENTVDSLEYKGNCFVLTGFKKTKQYLYTDCIQRQGGIVSDAVTKDTYCLIFNHAAKQATEEYLAAVTMNKKGCKIIIISDIVLENIWAEARKAIELEREQYLRAQGYYDKLPNIFDDKILEGTKELDESKISDTVKLLHLPKSLKTFKKREFNCDNGLTEMRPCKVKYFVDEGNESLFTDEDSLYEVLPDGTYRLLAYQYFGRGKVLILENTSEIGEGAFWGHRELKTIDLPKDLKAIRKDAFAGTSLEIVALPKGLKVIEKGAFRNCTRLQKALPVSSLEVIERGVFAGCTKLDKTQAAWWRDNVRKG